MGMQLFAAMKIIKYQIKFNNLSNASNTGYNGNSDSVIFNRPQS